MQDIGSSTQAYGITVTTMAYIICNSQHINETNITTTFTTKCDRLLQLLFFTAYTMFLNLLAKTMYFEF
jgi:hypothetical protein